MSAVCKPDDIKVHGHWKVECLNPDGSVAWIEEFDNAVTTEGLNHILNVEFHGTTQVTTWYVGLINNSPSPSLNAADTLASHAGWTEWTAFSETTRQAWAL